MSENDSDRYRAPALDKGLDILELLAEEESGLTQAEIAKRLDRSPSEFYRMLDRLVKRGYVTRMEGDRFTLSLKLFGLAQRHAPIRRLTSFAVPVMRDLAEATRQANQLVVFDRGNPVVVAQQEAPGYWGISIRVGSRIGLLDTGSGHVLLAFRSAEERERMIAEHLGNGPDGWGLSQSVLDRLETIRTQGMSACRAPRRPVSPTCRCRCWGRWQGDCGADHSLPAADRCRQCAGHGRCGLPTSNRQARRCRSCRAPKRWFSTPRPPPFGDTRGRPRRKPTSCYGSSETSTRSACSVAALWRASGMASTVKTRKPMRTGPR